MATKKTTPKISDYDTYSASPYTVEIYTKSHIVKAEHQAVTDEKGEVWGMYKVPKNTTVLHDSRAYTKLFNGNALLFATLIEPSTKMLYYICDNIKPGSDEICVLQSDYNKFFGYKDTNRFVYYKAVEGLLRANIISRRTGSTACFFVNPDIVFNGDRTKLKNIRIINPNRQLNFQRDETTDTE